MPIIAINSDYVRYLGGRYRDYQTVAIELRNRIQYRILGNPVFVRYLGPAVYELQSIVVRLNELDLSAGGDIRELYGLADRVEGLNVGGGAFRPPWFTSSYFAGAAPVFGASAFLSTLYLRRPAITSIGRLIYGRGANFDPVSQLARQGTYVNVVDNNPGTETLRAQRLLGEAPGGPGYQGQALD